LATLIRLPVIKLVLSCHDRLPIVHSRLRRTWRLPAKWFSGHGFVAARDVRRCSGFAHAVTAGSSIAARRAALKPASGSAAPPTAAINAARKAGSIIGTGSVVTANAKPELA
jgi:hypothetical protein